jgi:hypothetical protein
MVANDAISDYAFCRGLEYPSIVAVSQRVAWTVDEIFANRRFDVTKHIVPDSWLGTGRLAFLDDHEQRTLNHIRAFSYAHLLGNYEEFIPLQMAEVSGGDWHDDRARLRGLFRFGEEEMKHQQLFRRTEDILEASCGHEFGRYFDAEKVRVTSFVNAVLAFPLLPRFLLLAAFELGTQRHYVESIRTSNGGGSDPLYVDVLKNHWIEESQHVKLDLLEAARLAAGMSSDELSQAFDGVWDWEALSAKHLRDRSSRNLRPSELRALSERTNAARGFPMRLGVKHFPESEPITNFGLCQ